MKIKVKLGTVNNAVLFSAKCNEYKDYDIDFINGKYIVDAKSLMGILSIGLEKECIVQLHCNNSESIKEQFIKDMKLWYVQAVNV